MLKTLLTEINRHKDLKKAGLLLRFFKTGPGEYGEGDFFLGINVPTLRKIAKKYYKDLEIDDVQKLLRNKFHEARMIALFILIIKYKNAAEKSRKQYFDFYLRNTKYINNWDLVDVTCRDIVGEYLLNKDRSVLYRLANSRDLWEKRIAMISTYAFIRRNDFKDALKIAEILLYDEHDLMQKAVGWMLREIGNRDLNTEEEFLKKYFKTMPRTALRYAIEKFPVGKRRSYLKKSPPPR